MAHYHNYRYIKDPEDFPPLKGVKEAKQLTPLLEISWQERSTLKFYFCDMIADFELQYGDWPDRETLRRYWRTARQRASDKERVRLLAEKGKAT